MAKATFEISQGRVLLTIEHTITGSSIVTEQIGELDLPGGKLEICRLLQEAFNRGQAMRSREIRDMLGVGP